MGDVYRALDRELGCNVALKTVALRRPETLLVLKEEFRTAAGLSHPNLVRLHELFAEGDDIFFTMELVEGVPFTGYVRAAIANQNAGTAEPRCARYKALFDATHGLIAALHELHQRGR